MATSNDTTIPPLKRCNKCNEEYPETTEFFRVSGKKLRKTCRVCERAQARAYKAAHPEEMHAYQQKWRAGHTEELRVYDHEYYLTHIEQKRRNDRIYHEKHRIEQAIKAHIYGVEHSEHKREYMRVWRRDNPDKMRQHEYERRARLTELPNDFPISIENRMFAYWDHRCAICGKPADFWMLIVPDHWIAVKDMRPDNPGTVATNMIPMCHSRPGVPAGKSCCNRSKTNKDPETWLVEHFSKRKATTILKRINTYFDWVRQQDSKPSASANGANASAADTTKAA